MVKLKIEVDDWDTEKTIKLTLPCEVNKAMDLSHEHLISYWESDMALGFYDDVVGLNNVIDNINSASPNMTLEILEELLDASNERALSSVEFIRKICDNDFMLEEIPVKIEGWTTEECVARFLAIELKIPFAKNITKKQLLNMSKTPDSVNWKMVWNHYANMGFKVVIINDSPFAFHWGDAE